MAHEQANDSTPTARLQAESHFQLNDSYPVNGTNPGAKASANKAGIGMSFGVNIGGKTWGSKTELRGTTTQDLTPWIYQLGAGLYFRFGRL